MKYKVVTRVHITTEILSNDGAIRKMEKYSIHIQALDDDQKIVYVDLGPESEEISRIGTIWSLIPT